MCRPESPFMVALTAVMRKLLLLLNRLLKKPGFTLRCAQ